MEDCAKEAVAPGGNPVAVRLTAGIDAPFCAATESENCADAPGKIDCAGVRAEIMKSGIVVPLPFRLVVWGEFGSLSVTTRVAG